MSSDKFYMELEAENKELQERLANLGGIMKTQAERDFYKEENEKLKEVVDYDGFKIQILETEVNNAMEYIDEAIERYSSPNPMVHKSTMLTDFDKLKKILMN